MKKQIVLALALAAASFAATAGERSYSYVEAGWNRATLDIDNNHDADFDGFAVRGSYGFNQFHVFGAYSSVNNDDLIDIDLNESQLGFGIHHAIDEKADVIGEVSYLRQEVEASAFGLSAKDHVNGYRLSAGVRGQLGEHIEATIKANYTDGSDLDSEFTPSAGLLVKFNQNWGLFVDAEAAEDVTRYAVGVRASF
jgi:outer membrane receptor protein involved in Fe transport